LFFNPNEKESQDFKEVWEKIASKMYGIVTIAGVNCDEDEEICDDFEAYGYPKIYVAPANIDEDYERYDGEMKLSKIASFAVKYMENFAQIVSPSNYDRFVKE